MLDREFRTVLDTIPDGVIVEAGERIAYMNGAYAHLLGYSDARELTTAKIDDIAHPEELERLRWFGQCRCEGKPAPTRYVFRARRRDGVTVSLDASISTARSDREMLITTVVREVPTVSAPSVELPGTKLLSRREKEVIDYLLAGRRSKEIALLLEVSEKTIWTHRARAFEKLAVRGIGDLFRVATEAGVIGGR